MGRASISFLSWHKKIFHLAEKEKKKKKTKRISGTRNTSCTVSFTELNLKQCGSEPPALSATGGFSVNLNK